MTTARRLYLMSVGMVLTKNNTSYNHNGGGQQAKGLIEFCMLQMGIGHYFIHNRRFPPPPWQPLLRDSWHHRLPHNLHTPPSVDQRRSVVHTPPLAVPPFVAVPIAMAAMND